MGVSCGVQVVRAFIHGDRDRGQLYPVSRAERHVPSIRSAHANAITRTCDRAIGTAIDPYETLPLLESSRSNAPKRSSQSRIPSRGRRHRGGRGV